MFVMMSLYLLFGHSQCSIVEVLPGNKLVDSLSLNLFFEGRNGTLEIILKKEERKK